CKPEVLHHFGVVNVSLAKERLSCKAGYVHGPKRMLEPGVLGAGINEMRAGELPYPAQALERGAVDDFFFDLREPDVLVDGIGDLACKVHIVTRNKEDLNFKLFSDYFHYLLVDLLLAFGAVDYLPLELLCKLQIVLVCL